MDRRTLSQLLSPEGWALLAQLPPYDEEQALRLSEGLRARGLDPDLVAGALTQSRLRNRARSKFGEFAGEMLFTESGLEQATRLAVAARHARRYADAGVQHVADLGCGLGGDAMAMAALGLRVLAVELDEETATLATVNLRAFEHAQVRLADATEVDLAADGIDAVFADPARRTRSGARVFDPRAYSPDLDTLLGLRHQVPNLGLKVGPGIPYTALPSQTHAQWISVDGNVVEAGLWFGDLATEGAGRSALLLSGESAHVISAPGDADARPVQAPAADLGAYLYEPDGAVIRAGLVAQLAERIEGHLLDESIAYVSTASAHETPFAVGYRVLDSFDFGLKRLRAYLRTREVGRVTIKKRGTAVVPDQLRQQLGLRGPNEATIVLTRLRGKQSVIVVEPLTRG
ncbi:methyltransferase domain-containing protein [Ruania alkalisoli]|uniref:Methyltransferase domain-containing protein n=1 Tax=Ruania alkalisoli TaxID=2779775 RepID=A0A7M1SR34_9MICO|nr:methyltransferase domain-containing protein [Ruania alkalisoli]QOR69935.1 methyltransferase domain-containing protein [Ruania alkalisoli]